MKQYRPDGNTQVCVFPTFGEFVGHLDSVADDRPGRPNTSDDWYGSDSLREAVTRMNQPWTQARKTIGSVLDSLSGSVRTLAEELVTTTRYAESGAFPDVARYLEGEDECMIEFVPDDGVAVSTVCRLLVDIGASARFSSEWMVKRAAAMAALVQVLNLAGRSVEIWIASPVTSTYDSSQVHDTVVCLQQAGVALNVDDIAFGLGHPSTLRRGFFEIRTNSATGFGDTGRTRRHLEWTREYLRPDLVIERAENEPSSVPDPAKYPAEWVRNALVRLGLLDQ